MKQESMIRWAELTVNKSKQGGVISSQRITESTKLNYLCLLICDFLHPHVRRVAFFVSDKSEINESNNQKMKTNVKTVGAYEAPKVEVIEVEVEQGFAASFDGDNPPTVENGGNPF